MWDLTTMTAPKHIFIDTNILDRAAYNFRSPRFVAFVAAASAKVTLLLPDPMEREIKRHPRH